MNPRSTEPRRTTPRERYREEVRGDAKQIALQQLASGGQEALSVNGVAREMGMSGPALYRYFANRDALLTELIVDAYRDLGALIDRVAGGGGGGADPAAQLASVARAVREWALAQPHRYQLLYGTPFAGYSAPEEASLAARESIEALLGVMIERYPAAPSARRRDELDRQLEAAPWLPEELRGKVAGSVLADVLLSWSRIHGLIGLEINGQFAQMGFDPALLFERELESLTDEGSD